MVARAQRALILLLGLAVIFSLLALGYFRLWSYALSALLVLLAILPAVLAAEFALLWRVESVSERPAIASLLLAWAKEVLANLVSFGWDQAFFSESVPDSLPSKPDGRRGVLLIHGLACNRGIWNPWLRRLHTAGHPYVAVNLEPMFSPIETYSDSIAAAFQCLRSATALAPVVVAHSMGGLAARHWLSIAGPEVVVHRIITIGTPHRGTWMARFARSPSGAQMSIDSPWLSALATHAEKHNPLPFTCFYGRCDNVVFPTSNATMPGADNRKIDATGHVALVRRREVYEEVVRWLV